MHFRQQLRYIFPYPCYPNPFGQSLLIISPVTRCAATWPLELELKFFLSNSLRMSTATEMCLRDHNSNNCTRSGNVCCCTYVVNNDYDKFRSFSRLYMTLFRHRTCIYLHGRADRFLVSVSNGQVAALSDWAYYHLGFGAVYLGETSRLRFLRDSD